MMPRAVELLSCKVAEFLGNRETAASSNPATQQPGNPTP